LITLSLHNIGKKYNREWIFRNISCDIAAGSRMVILGGNGSGKSTLLQVISGFITPNEGELIYKTTELATAKEKVIESENIKDQISFASPYLQLIEDFTAVELVEHLSLYKPFKSNFSSREILELAQLSYVRDKFIKQYSSGMKQRLKLAIAILADSQILLLDEPLSNLDAAGCNWYKSMIAEHGGDRSILVCSNAIKDEYYFCDRELNVMDHKGI
jgi:ABC-type multidrug transport system ATPase subunit